MIVFKITYDTSVVADFAPTFNNGWGYDYTTKTSTSGTLKTVTYESDTAFTAISIPNDNRNCIKSVYIDLSGVTNVYNLFVSCREMTEFIAVNATNKLTSLGQFTFDCAKLTHITYENCDLSSVTNIQNIFQTGAMQVVTNATFKNVKFNNTTKSMISLLCKATTMVVEDCDFSSVTSFYQMFANCVGLKGTLDLSMYDFTNVYETTYMFSGCTNLTKIIMPKGTFDKITNCGAMFQNCTSLVEIDLSGFHIPNAQNISYMFSGCASIEEIDCSALGVLNPTNINHMFISCQKLKRVNLSGIKVPKSISFSHMFYESPVVEWIDISNIVKRASDATNFWRSGTVVKNIGMLYCPADVINAFARDMVSSGRTCNIYYHDAKLEDLTVDSRFNYIYCEEYHGDVVSTPDDLELYCNHYYDGNTKKSSPCYQDTLDLTTGTVTRKNIKARLNDCIAKLSRFGCALVTVNGGDMVRVRYDHTNSSSGILPVQIDGEVIGTSATGIVFSASQGGYDGRWNPTGDIEHAYTDVNTLFMFFNPSRFDGIDYTDSETIKNWLIEQDFTLIIKIQNASVYTEQLPTSLNPLKSYYNGSIQTSSQQLVPTLKTTLPVSNKFTTTNLTSGLTYNVYFDGTATKLDAGGTIITNPISPCEVECGGTTLTIEGTNIQNVRVLETTNKNEVGSVCGTTDVELSKVITSDLEVITNDIEFSSAGTDNGNINTVDNKLGTINTKGSHSWGAGYFTSNKTYPKGFSLLHIEFDVDMPSNNLMAIINFNNNVSHIYYNFRDLTLDNDTATIAQGQTSGIEVKYSSIVTKGHFSRLVYCFSSQGKINLNINTGSSAMSTASGNNAEGSTSGYTACANNGITISNFKIKVIENYPDATVSSQVTSSLRTNNGLTVIWQDMDMSIGQSTSKLEQPIKLRSLGTTYDSYNPITGELTKRIGVSETDGSYSVLSSPIVSKVKTTLGMLTNIRGERITLSPEQRKHDYLLNNCKPNTDYFIVANVMATESTRQINIGFIVDDTTWSGSPVTLSYGEMRIKLKINSGSTPNYLRIYANSCENLMIIEHQDNIENKDIPYFEGTQDVVINDAFETPHLYTNGQVKVYSDSEVYPTTILNGQSTNNYEINGLNTSNNYTIRYDGECESINLANKSNTQGTNRIVKSGATSGNLTFVNDNEDIDNVLLVQNDVREQEINHFTGLQTVEINQLLVSNKQNLFEQYMKADYDYTTDLRWGTQQYGSLHNGVFKCGELVGGENLQMVWNLIRPHADMGYNSQPKEDNPIVLANKVYNISFNISIVDHHTVDGGHNYNIRAYDFDGNEVIPQQATGGRAWLSIGSNGVTNPTPTNFINLDVIFSKDVYCFVLHADYGGAWKFDCTITDFTICEPENAKPDLPLVYEYIDLPQPVQLNSLPDGTCDTYNPITGEYVQNVGVAIWSDIKYINREAVSKDKKWASYWLKLNGEPGGNGYSALHTIQNSEIPVFPNISDINQIPYVHIGSRTNTGGISLRIPVAEEGIVDNKGTGVIQWLKDNNIHMYYKLDTEITTPITTQLTPINIPTFEGGIVQLITTDGKVFPMIEYSMPTNNRYDTTSWEAGAVYTQRNMTEAYFNESTTPMIPTETTTLTTDHISSGSIILNDNGNGLIVLKGNYTGRDIPYFTGMRSVEAIEIETTPSPDQPLFGKGGRK